MTKWYDATQGVVEAANQAMREIADNASLETYEKIERIHDIWQTVATALSDSIREDLDENWPEEAALAKALDVDCVGQTSDTGKIVSWGPDTGDGFRPFHVHETAEIPDWAKPSEEDLERQRLYEETGDERLRG